MQSTTALFVPLSTTRLVAPHTRPAISSRKFYHHGRSSSVKRTPVIPDATLNDRFSVKATSSGARTSHLKHSAPIAAHLNGSSSTFSEAEANDPSSSSSDSSTSRQLDPVERRPELVGGVPLWLLFNAAEKLRKFAMSMSSPSRTVSLTSEEQKTNEPLQPEKLTPDMLRLIATQLEDDLASLRRDVESADQVISVQESKIQLLEQQVREKDKEDASIISKTEHETAQRLFRELCASQTREAAMRKRVESVQGVIRSLRQERDSAQQDIVKALVLCLFFLVLLGGSGIQNTAAWLELLFK